MLSVSVGSIFSSAPVLELANGLNLREQYQPLISSGSMFVRHASQLFEVANLYALTEEGEEEQEEEEAFSVAQLRKQPSADAGQPDQLVKQEQTTTASIRNQASRTQQYASSSAVAQFDSLVSPTPHYMSYSKLQARGRTRPSSDDAEEEGEEEDETSLNLTVSTNSHFSFLLRNGVGTVRLSVSVWLDFSSMPSSSCLPLVFFRLFRFVFFFHLFVSLSLFSYFAVLVVFRCFPPRFFPLIRTLSVKFLVSIIVRRTKRCSLLASLSSPFCMFHA